MGGSRVDMQCKGRNFRFEAKWCLDSSFEGTIRRWWADSSASVPNKLEILGNKLLKWHSSKSREERRKWTQLEQRLEGLFSQDVSDDVLAEISEVQLDLNLEADKEEIFWEQRAHVNWLKNGDHNTSYFHKMAGQRFSHGRIHELVDGNGVRHTELAEMLKVASSYFDNLFTASEMGFDEHLLSLVKRKVTDNMNDYLLQPFTEDDVWNALKSMAPLKALGVDGFLAVFFQRYWHIVGPEVSRYCLEVLNGQIEFGEINKTRIVLILKVDKPKLITMLGERINEAQGAFVPGRLISDNILIAYEVLHSMKRKKSEKKGHFALKLDMSKAYDRVEWDFLVGMMKALGFHVDWIVLVMRCISSVVYSVCLNGEDSEIFSPSRSLRQGDPLSPFLFLICAEGFSTLLEDAKQRGSIDATREGAVIVRDIIHEYEMCVGQKMNYEKSLVYFGANVNEGLRDEITSFLGVRRACNLEKYLGLPMMVGRRKTWAFADFIDRFRKRVTGWTLRFLSMGGKEGDRVNIWNDHWLPGKDNNKVSGHEINPRWSYVSQLIEEDTQTWNGELIRNIVDEATADRILSIPIAGRCTEDMLVWKYEGSGDYSVKSGYRVLITTNTSSTPNCSNEEDYKDFYKALWQLHVGLEDSSHLMWSCGTLKRMWSHLQVQIPDLEETWCSKKRLVFTFIKVDEQQRGRIAISLWSLCTVQLSLLPIIKSDTKELWRPPDEGLIKLNFDATFNSAERIATTAVIARDSTGIIRGVETYLINHIADPFMAEARACERAVIFALFMGFRRLVVEGDSLTVIKNIEKKAEDRSVLRPIIYNIRQMGSCFEEIFYRHVRWSANGVAHTMALEGRRTNFSGKWIGDLPVSIQRLALRERTDGVLRLNKGVSVPSSGLESGHESGFTFRYFGGRLPSDLSVRNGNGGSWSFECKNQGGGWFSIRGRGWGSFFRSHRMGDTVSLSMEDGDNFYTISVN
ncbi:reverse transcriptase [Gossypium australe]|uniref:Reverse transcriptase n=1 Tax=Gossypium australe TaxID=47621 RepID=A0A5B6WM96_9ROSI|nr:reverse transcriptase [Gossypium australe]